MNVLNTNIEGVVIFEPKVYGDERGFFMETFRQSTFNNIGLDVRFVQDNHSQSSKAVLRGLHYQIRQPQGKLVRVTSGEVYDVAVDLRQNSATFGQHVGVTLSAENKKILWVPPGFAHGFLVLSESAEFVYKCTQYYVPELERTIIWDDPELNIAWPLTHKPELSEKDKLGKPFKQAETFNFISA